jgi:hypothetical protein
MAPLAENSRSAMGSMILIVDCSNKTLKLPET